MFNIVHSLMEILTDPPNCPLCGRPLSWGIRRPYETLDDHVSNPNMEAYPLRPTLVCTNEECITFSKGFWSEPTHGEWYSTDHEGPRNIPPLSTSWYHGENDQKKYNDRGVRIPEQK